MSFPHADTQSDDPLSNREQQVLDDIAGFESDSPLTIETRQQEGVQVVRLSGELDVATAPQFEERLFALLDTNPAAVVVDLSSLSFLDSKGLAAFLRATARRPEGMAIASPRERICRLFQATGLAERLRVKGSLPEAMEAARQRSSVS